MPSTPARQPAGLVVRQPAGLVVRQPAKLAQPAGFVRRAAGAALVAAVAAAGFVALPPAAPAVAASDTQPAERFPEPSLYPISWELKFTHGTPKRIVVRVPGETTPQAYWYMTYSVANPGDKEVEFDPVFEMLTEDGKTHRANRAIPSDVFDAIKRREGNKLLEAPRKVAGYVRAGDDQARDSVAIWPEPMLRMGTFTIFAAGLSGEQVTVKKVGDRWVPINPKTAAEELKDVKEEDRMHLRKQYSVRYRVLGDEIAPGNDPIQKRESRWVMRP